MTTINPTQSKKKARNRFASSLRRSWYSLLCCFAVCLWGNALQATQASHTIAIPSSHISYYLTEEDKTLGEAAKENSLASQKSDSVTAYQVLVERQKKLTRIGRFVINHSFILPGIVGTLTTCLAMQILAKICL